MSVSAYCQLSCMINSLSKFVAKKYAKEDLIYKRFCNEMFWFQRFLENGA